MSLKFYTNNVSNQSNVKIYDTNATAVKMYGYQVWRKQISDWEILFSGSQEFTKSGSLKVAGLTANSIVDITADIMFIEFIEGRSPTSHPKTIIYERLPTKVEFNLASVNFTVADGWVDFEFVGEQYDFKGLDAFQFPGKVVIKEVRRKL